jgi:hypothetical protein
MFNPCETMRLELAERLRCPRAHAPTPLVVVASQVVERELRGGMAGCMVCRFEARFVEGDLVADGARVDASLGATPGADGDGPRGPEPSLELDRLVALLGLAEPGGAVLLTGPYAAAASELAALCDVAVITDRARAVTALEDPVSALVGFGDAIPFAEGSFRGAALGVGVSPARAREVVRVLPRGARIVGAVTLDLPTGARELARDEREWVAEVEGQAPLVSLGRAPLGR